MSGSNRGIIVAFGLVALTSWALFAGWYLGSLSDSQDERYQPYRYASDKPLEIDATAAGQAGPQPFEYRTPCSDPKGQSESDLCAQWRAANAAEDSAFWTKWGFWVSTAALFALFWTLHYTREAVKDTGDATKAMIEANRIAREAHERELRAYVSITNVAVGQFIGGKTPKFGIELVNTGQTPAIGLYIIAQQFWYRPHQGEPRIRFHRDSGVLSRFVLAPDKPFPHQDFLRDPITDGQAEELNTGQIGLIYAGVIVYRDVFKRRHMTAFKCRFDHERASKGGGPTGLAMCLKGNISN